MATAYFKRMPRICLKKLRKTKKAVVSMECPNQDLKQVPLEYMSDEFLLWEEVYSLHISIYLDIAARSGLEIKREKMDKICFFSYPEHNENGI